MVLQKKVNVDTAEVRKIIDRVADIYSGMFKEPDIHQKIATWFEHNQLELELPALLFPGVLGRYQLPTEANGNVGKLQIATRTLQDISRLAQNNLSNTDQPGSLAHELTHFVIFVGNPDLSNRLLNDGLLSYGVTTIPSAVVSTLLSVAVAKLGARADFITGVFGAGLLPGLAPLWHTASPDTRPIAGLFEKDKQYVDAIKTVEDEVEKGGELASLTAKAITFS